MKLVLQIFKTMKKSEFRVLIKVLISQGKILFEHTNGLISVIRTLLHQKQRLRGGILTLNAVVQTQIMLKAQVTQIWQLPRKTPKKLHKLILADRKLNLREIVEERKISEGNEFAILHEHL